MPHVANTENEAGVVALGGEGVAGNDIRCVELDTSFLPDHSDAHLVVVLEPDGVVHLDVGVLEHVHSPAMVRRGQNDVAFHSSLTTFIQLFLKGFIFGLDGLNISLVSLAVSQLLRELEDLTMLVDLLDQGSDHLLQPVDGHRDIVGPGLVPGRASLSSLLHEAEVLPLLVGGGVPHLEEVGVLVDQVKVEACLDLVKAHFGRCCMCP